MASHAASRRRFLAQVAGTAMALAAGSCCQEIVQELPHVLVEDLENGAYGRQFLTELNARLMSLLP